MSQDIQDDEAEVGPIDDDIEEIGGDPACGLGFEGADDQGAGRDAREPDDVNGDLHYALMLQKMEDEEVVDGAYYDGDEPEDDDSQEPGDD